MASLAKYIVNFADQCEMGQFETYVGNWKIARSRSEKNNLSTGAPNVNFRKISVRNTIGFEPYSRSVPLFQTSGIISSLLFILCLSLCLPILSLRPKHVIYFLFLLASWHFNSG